MPTTRRELLGAGASLALGTLPTGASAQTAQPGSAASPEWDPGSVAHLLPTSSHDRILIKASFHQPPTAPQRC